MTDYISRETALEAVERYFTELLELNPDICLDGIKSIPATDVRPVVRGEWLAVDDRNDAFDCSVCDAMVSKRLNFCPHCGAKMGGGQD